MQLVLAKSSYNASFAVHVNGGWSGSVTGGNGETSMDKNFKTGTRFVYMLVGMSGQVGAEVGGKQEEVVLQGSRWR